MPLAPLTESKSLVLRSLECLRGTMITITLFTLLMVCNVMQVLSAPLALLTPRVFRRANRSIVNAWWGLCALLAEKLYKINFVISGDNVPVKENTLVVLNHQDMTDIAVLFTLARSKQRLGDLKWFVKHSMKWFPGVGWGMQFLDCLFVKRNWTKDKVNTEKVFNKILKFKVPLWLMIFAEGTRIKPHKIIKSEAYAKSIGRQPLKHLLLPRTIGFVATIESLRGHLDAVYDVTIGYVDGVPSLWQWAKGSVRKVHLHVRRYAMDTIPAGSQATSAWLMDRFVEKDTLLAGFYASGSFVEKSYNKLKQA